MATATGRHRLTRRDDLHRNRKVVAIIAAHNEEDCIAETLMALSLQTRPPNEIYVFTDNCTDRTAEVAARFSRVSVTCTVDNADKKAGVLNRATALLLPGLKDSDVVMGFDADSVPDMHFVANALGYISRGYGIVGATFHARRGGGVLGLLQRAEFARFAVSQHKRTRCDVISGTGWASPAGTLRAVARTRMDGQVYDTRSIVEDFELTLALQTMGVKAISPAACRVTTDVMITVRTWWSQRLRWQHGTLVALRQYGWTPVTRGMIVRQLLTYLVMLATPLAAVYLAWSFILFGWRGVDPANAPLYAGGDRHRGHRADLAVAPGGPQGAAHAAAYRPRFPVLMHAAGRLPVRGVPRGERRIVVMGRRDVDLRERAGKLPYQPDRVVTPGAYSDLSHVIAVVTITMAVLAIYRLLPRLRSVAHRFRRSAS